MHVVAAKTIQQVATYFASKWDREEVEHEKGCFAAAEAKQKALEEAFNWNGWSI